jgi:hypothetical protein
MRTILISSALLSLALIGCDDKGNGDSAEPTFLDNDNDGFSQDEGDCDDADPLRNPAALETCNGIDDNCNDVTDEDGAFDAFEFFLDFDGDGYGVPNTAETPSVYTCEQPTGYVDNQIDCNDSEPASYPGRDEICDFIDNDCDGAADEGTAVDAITWYEDNDEDDYGSPYAAFVSCPVDTQGNGPAGYVANNEDCNDQRIDINPGAPEVCDGQTDEDCDTLIDDQDPDATGKTTFYYDADGDGWGREDVSIESCVEQPLFVEASPDCDDDNRFVNPDYNEICGNLVDDDCDTVIDNGTDDIQWYTDGDGDGYGDPESPGLIQCSQPSGQVNNDEDCNDGNINIYPGAVEVWYDGVDSDCFNDSDFDADRDGYDSEAYGSDDCDDSDVEVNPGLPEICEDGKDNNCDDVGDTCKQDAALFGELASSRLGDGVDFAGDWDGDGEVDALLGGSRYDGPKGNALGAAYIVSGPITGASDVGTSYDLRVHGAANQDYLGIAVAGLGNYDGNDSYSDIAISAYGYDGPTGAATESGAVYIINGPLLGDYDIDTVYDAMFYGESSRDWAGFAIDSAGDVNDDGYDDLVIGAYRHDPLSVSDAGAAYLILGPASSSSPQNLSFADTKLYATSSGEWAGYSVAGGGDLDGDGETEIVIGAPQLSSGLSSFVGGAYIASYDASASSALSTSDGMVVGIDTASFTGYSVAIAGDINNDGRDDILIGAPEQNTSGTASGAVYVFFGPVTGLNYAYNADAIIGAENADDYLGASVDGAGDVDNDSYDDIVIGAPLDDYSASNAGAAYIVTSPIFGSYSIAEIGNKFLGADASDKLGSVVAGGGDINDDGYSDILTGAPYNSDNKDVSGAVYLILGGGF